jgi:thiol-disulfide isomerase/thioredoxin
MMKFNVPIYTAVAVIVAAMLFSCATVETPQMGPMETLRSSVILADGTPLPADGAYILLYYAADWCPYCLEYTEQLKSSYTALKSLYGRSFDLVFVGHVNDTENEQLLAFMEMGGYPFGYLPYEKREASGVMALMGEDRFYIPGLLLIDREGTVLSSSNGASIDDYVRDRPIYALQALKIQDCASCQK